MVGLGDFDDRDEANSNANYSYAKGISADGRVIVGGSASSVESRTESFRYTKSEGMISLGVDHEFFLFDRAGPQAASSDGSVIVGSTGAEGVGFRYTKSEGIDSIDPNSFGAGGGYPAP